MGFDPSYIITSSTILGWRTDPLGALSANWSLIACLSPRDISVNADGVSNVVVQDTTSLAAPSARHIVPATQSANIRVSGLIRVKAPGGTGFGTTYLGFIDNAVGVAYYVQISGSGSRLRLAAGGTFIDIAYVPTPNTWYRVGIEKIGTTLTGYWSPTPNTNRDLVASDTSPSFVPFNSLTIADTANPLYVWLSMSSPAASAIDYNGLSDATLYEMVPPTTQAPLSGGGSGASFTMPFSPYTRYKTIRQAVGALNNLSLAP